MPRKIAVLDGAGLIVLTKEIWTKAELDADPKLTAFTPKPGHTVADQQPGWVAGGKVVSGVYTPPPAPDFSTIDQAILNHALAAEGSVVRALGLLMFREINKLRAKNGDAAYTMAQFAAALKAEMR